MSLGEAVNLAAKLKKHNKAESSAACASKSLIEPAKAQDGSLVPSGFEFRLGRQVASAAGLVDLAVWPESRSSLVWSTRFIPIQSNHASLLAPDDSLAKFARESKRSLGFVCRVAQPQTYPLNLWSWLPIERI
jgi:hypothetical protein